MNGAAPTAALVWQDGHPWITSPAAFRPAALELATIDYPEDFALGWPLSRPMVEAAALAGFMPMSLRIETADGPVCLFTPKLHRERCLLEPCDFHVTTTVRREARRYSFSFNRDFDAVLAACVRHHGDGWLTEPLRAQFLAASRSSSPGGPWFVSFELWWEGSLAAGEIGYLAGSVYASLSGFHNLSGAGSVQLAALAGWLRRHGIRYWDLGMALPYKLAIGGGLHSREVYLPLLYEAYSQRVSDLRPADPQVSGNADSASGLVALLG